MKTIISEFLGTFCLVFCGTGAIVIDQTTAGAVSHTGIGLTFGLIVMCLIFVFGESSGAHFNPAVTFAFVIARRFPLARLPGYVLAQTFGACAASLTLLLLFPEATALGNTIPRDSALQAFALEVILALILILVILSVSSGSKEKGLFAAIAIGGAVGLEAIFAGPITGASMNPVRSLAPALATFDFTALWVYLLAPFIGAVAAFYACSLTQAPGCCAEGGCG